MANFKEILVKKEADEISLDESGEAKEDSENLSEEEDDALESEIYDQGPYDEVEL